jgi:bifunctional non-homologous end joining protein LigD
MSLAEYQRKRDFRKTAEPPPARPKRAGSRFVVQKHAASRLHYDFRLEVDGALKSWAVPKGIPCEHGARRLAVQVEDHPVSYIDFEGAIPKGQYGGGTVMVWDSGTFEPIGGAPREQLEHGKLHFALHGSKLEGEWRLVRMRDGDNWLLIRGGASMKPVSKKMDDTSALSGKSMREIARGDRVWASRGASDKDDPAPLPGFVEPMKARLVARPPRSGDWIYEIKFDGFRALALRGGAEARLLSRNEKDLGAKFPDVLAAVAALDVREAVLDGEIVALDDAGRSSFQLLQQYEMGREKPPLFYYVFDLLRLDGKDLRARPLGERKAALQKILPGGDGAIRFSDSLGDDAEALLDQARRLGLEGLVGKREGSGYEPGARSGAWIKLKLVREQEFVIGGYTDPEGSRKFFGALVVGVFDAGRLRFCAKVGTGFDHTLLRSLHARLRKLASDACPFADLPQTRANGGRQAITKTDMQHCHWVEPTLVCQVKFSEWTQDGHLRQPVFMGLREDKEAAEVVREEA